MIYSPPPLALTLLTVPIIHIKIDCIVGKMGEDRDSRKGGKLVRVALLRNRLWGEIHRYPRFNIPLNLCQTFAPHSTGLYNTYGGHWHMGHLRPWGFHIEQPCRKRAMHVANLATHLLAAR